MYITLYIGWLLLELGSCCNCMSFFNLLDLLLSEKQIHSKTLQIKYQKFKVHIFAYFICMQI